MKRLLWLDDYRDPFVDDWLNFSPIGKNVEVYWVKSYYEFCDWIILNDLPDAICFDHDLGKTLETELIKRGVSKKDARKRKGEEKTGYDAAKWLVEWCINNKKDIPLWSVQSANPVGRENINTLLNNFLRYQQNNKG